MISASIRSRVRQEVKGEVSTGQPVTDVAPENARYLQKMLGVDGRPFRAHGVKFRGGKFRLHVFGVEACQHRGRTARESVTSSDILAQATSVAIPLINGDRITQSSRTEIHVTAGTAGPCEVRVGGYVW